MASEVNVPDEFYQWSASAKRAWMAGALTQREMLAVAAEDLGLSVAFDGEGRQLTNEELARFLVALTDPGGDSGHAL